MNRKNLLLVSTLMCVGFAVYFFFPRKKISTQHSAIDVIAQADERVVADLKKKISDLEEERSKLLDEHQKRLQMIDEEHKKVLADLTRKKTESRKEIEKKYHDDMPGLARELSGLTGLKVVE